MVSIVWFRRSLRLGDNESVHEAVRASSAVVCAFVLPEPGDPSTPGSASLSWLRRSLRSLDLDLRQRGSALVLRCGPSADALVRLADECGATAVWCQRDWTPEGLAEETAVRTALEARGIGLRVCEGQLLVQPGALTTRGGESFRIFTPFFNAWRQRVGLAPLLPAPERIPSPPLTPPTAGPPAETPGVPDVDRWWRVGEDAATQRVEGFTKAALGDYEVMRERPDVDGTSRLSPHLAWGEISPRQVVAACEPGGAAAEPFIRQLAWREFSYHVLAAKPNLASVPVRPEFADFPWMRDEAAFTAWRDGLTGYPLVDAGMRQLLATGWVHNRVRMVCASFLTKHLLQPWQDGEAHFRERLVDHDTAANAFNWQWVAGSGMDAAPYFRVFNPRLQAERHDPTGAYVREWVPELGTDEYPPPIIDHAEARRRALAAWQSIR